MKKLALVLVLVLAFTLTALANPFVDVPLNHWAYDSVQSLAAKGVIVGYPDGTFGGGKSLTRYEFAEATAKALAYVEGMDFAAAEDVAILEKLAIEFADELASLGVTVADLEASLGANTEAIAALETTVAKLDTFFEPVKITGSFTATFTDKYLKYDVIEEKYAKDPAYTGSTLTAEGELNLVATINDNTTAGVTFYTEEGLEDLSRLFPQARIGIAHGQMAEEQLEDIMIDFLEKKYDILVCTTIIEIGLDIPNVNTIIIDDAHKFGLSQLYQLRGRVGRSDRRAYAYFLYPSYRSISDTAKKRLQAIKEFSELGSGFKLAMRDLEIRGAGNLLGKEQHGSVGEVGFNLYCRLLEEAIKELREEKEGKQKRKDITPVIDVKIDAYIPGGYIPDLKQRVLIYKKLAEIKDLEDLERAKEELRDRYGIYPRELRNLLEIIYLKIFLRKLGISSLVVKENKLILRYLQDIEIKAKLSRLPSFYQQRLIEEEHRLSGISKINLSGIKSSEILKFLKEFVIHLAK